MRVWILLFLAALAGAGDLRPRAGSGWAGFRPGTWVRIKRTTIMPGKVPKVIIWKQSLAKVGERTLTLETISKNVLGLGGKKTQELPRTGEAGPGEKQKVERLKNEVVVAAGKSLDCARRRTTVTGPGGKRVVTTWTATEPQVLAKRTAVHYDAGGKLVYTVTQLLASTSESREVGSRTVRCVKHKTRLSHQNGTVTSGTALSSRDVPGGLVWVEEEMTKGAASIFTSRVELLAFLTK
jgi:hypothetical protein